MRYSRMMSAPPKRRKGRAANLIIVIIILGMAAYLISAGAAGSWLANNIINPVFNNGNANAADTSVAGAEILSPGETLSPSPAVSSSASGERAEEQITVKEITVYALQSGAFSDIINAEAAAKIIKEQGGAGYIANDGNLYKVLIAGYTDKNDADEVMASLKSQGVATTMFEIKSGKLTFKIGAQRGQIDAVSACFDAAPDTVESLLRIIFNADKGQNVNGEITALKEKLYGVLDSYEAAVSKGETSMQGVSEYFDKLRDTVDGLPDSASVSTAELSSGLKYALIQIASDYSSFLSKLNA